MNLAMMRDIDRADPIGGLGPRVTPAPTPAPEPVKRPDGFVEGPDGKLSTSLPPPAVPRRGPWPFPTGAAAPAPEPEPGAHGFMRKPLKVGDRVLLIDPAGEYYPSLPVGEMVVTKIYKGGFDALHEADTAKPLFYLGENEGKTWERINDPA